MLKHVLQYLLITAAFVSLPFVLYFAVIALAEVDAEAQRESLEPPLPEARSSPTPEPLTTPIPTTTTPTSIDEKPTAGTNTLTLDEVGGAFWLKRRDEGMYDAVADLNWVADGIDANERDPVMVLIELGLDAPIVAAEYIETSWFSDALTEDEAWAFLGLTYIDSYATDDSSMVSRLPWVLDGINENESWAVSSLPDIFDGSPESGNALISKPWFQDGITREESEAVELLGALAYKTDSASEFVSMPFLDSIEMTDVLALSSLYQLALLNWTTLATPSEFDEFMSRAEIADGITDEEAVFVALASDTYEFNPGLADRLLDIDEVMSESRTISLPLAGDVELLIVRTQPGSARSLDMLEQSVRFAERYMGEPFPTNYVALLYSDAVKPGFAGHNSGTNIVVHPDFDSDAGSPESEEAEFVIMHEVAHYYWSGSSQHWIDEGAAEFLTITYVEGTIGLDIGEFLPSGFIHEYDCTDVSLKALEKQTSSEADDCAYDLGLLFFLDLHQELGVEEFRQGFKKLYLSGKDVLDPESPEARNISHVREAFDLRSDRAARLLEKWYERK